MPELSPHAQTLPFLKPGDVFAVSDERELLDITHVGIILGNTSKKYFTASVINRSEPALIGKESGVISIDGDDFGSQRYVSFTHQLPELVTLINQGKSEAAKACIASFKCHNKDTAIAGVVADFATAALSDPDDQGLLYTRSYAEVEALRFRMETLRDGLSRDNNPAAMFLHNLLDQAFGGRRLTGLTPDRFDDLREAVRFFVMEALRDEKPVARPAQKAPAP